MRAPRFPPPLWGRDRERGGDEALRVRLVARTDSRMTAGCIGRYETEAVRVLPLSLSLPHKGGGNDVALLCLTTSSVRVHVYLTHGLRPMKALARRLPTMMRRRDNDLQS